MDVFEVGGDAVEVEGLDKSRIVFVDLTELVSAQAQGNYVGTEGFGPG